MEITVKGRGRHAPRLLSSFPNSGSVRTGQWWQAGTVAPRVLAGQPGLNQPSPKLNAAAGRLHSSGTGRASQRVSVLPKKDCVAVALGRVVLGLWPCSQPPHRPVPGEGTRAFPREALPRVAEGIPTLRWLPGER